MKKYVLILVLFLIPSLCFGETFIFRSTNWGMSKNQVKQIEKLTVEEEHEDSLFYTTTLSSLDSLIAYSFTNDKLFQTAYMFLEEHSNSYSYIEDFDKIDNLLTQKYGEPNASDKIWKNDLFKDDYKGWGTALSAGHLTIISKWEIEDTEITHIAYGDNFEVKHAIIYKSKKYAPSEIEQNQDDLSNL